MNAAVNVVVIKFKNTINFYYFVNNLAKVAQFKYFRSVTLNLFIQKRAR